MKKLSSTAYAVIAIISIVLIVAFTYLWATMTGTVSNVFAAAPCFIYRCQKHRVMVE